MKSKRIPDDQEENPKDQPPLSKAAEAAMVAQFEANAKVDAESRSDKPLSDEN